MYKFALLLALSSFFAIKDAIRYANNNKINLIAPATPENILNAIKK